VHGNVRYNGERPNNCASLDLKVRGPLSYLKCMLESQQLVGDGCLSGRGQLEYDWIRRQELNIIRLKTVHS
jgi:hypothetical protein